MKAFGIISKGLDPRSAYPACDFCSCKQYGPKDKKRDGGVRVGRWWAHEECALDPENLKLSSAQLPALDYTEFLTSRNPILSMERRVSLWARKILARVRLEAKHRGESLCIETSPTEYL